MRFVDRLNKLLSILEDEFETHYLDLNWIYRPDSKELFFKIESPLSSDVLILAAKIPKNINKCFDFLEIDWVDKIYEFINKEAKKMDVRYGKQHKITKWLKP